MNAIQKQFFSPLAWQDFFIKHPEKAKTNSNIGLIMAGNLPGIGLHDLLMVLASGQVANVKLSSQDKSLMQLYVSAMKEFDPLIPIHFIDRLQGMDAVIATGSDFSGGYFSHYFSTTPHIIRKNRSSVAVLSGRESNIELTKFGNDIFDYFGLGCRNVSKLLIPKGYDIGEFFRPIETYQPIINHHKYNNNYDYNKAVFLMSNFKLLDNEFLTLKEDKSYASPISSVFYEYYEL